MTWWRRSDDRSSWMLAWAKNTVKGCCMIRLHTNLPWNIVTHGNVSTYSKFLPKYTRIEAFNKKSGLLMGLSARSWCIEILWFCITPINSLMSIVHNRVLAPALTLDTSSALSLPEKPAWGNWLCMAQDHKLHATSDHQGNRLSQEMSFQPSKAGKSLWGMCDIVDDKRWGRLAYCNAFVMLDDLSKYSNQRVHRIILTFWDW